MIHFVGICRCIFVLSCCQGLVHRVKDGKKIAGG